MAIIREKKNFQIGRIGVSRSSRQGQSGGQIVGQAISTAADQFAAMFYKEAAANAEKVGIEQGRSADRQSIITIDPKTGEPEAYEPPSGFGRIASEAYERVVLRRFEQSIEDEIQNKGKELAARFENHSNGVALYEDAMSTYIASMTNVAEGQFKGYISDVGISYLNATRTSMAINQVRRERAAAKRSQAAAVGKANSTIEFLLANEGPTGLMQDTETQAIIGSADATKSDGAQAGLFNLAETQTMDKATRLSVARGLIRYAAKQSDDPDTLKMLQHAVGTQNPNAVPPEFAYVADSMRGFSDDYSSLADLEKFSDGLLSDAVQYAGVVQADEIEKQDSEMALTIFDMRNDTSVVASAERTSAANPDTNIPAATSRAVSMFIEYTERARNAVASGDSDLSNEIMSQRNAVVDAQSEGLYLRAVSGVTSEDVKSLELAIFNRDASIAPEGSQAAIRAIIKLDTETDRPVIDNFLTFAGSYADNAGKAVLAEAQYQAALQAQSIDIRGISFSKEPDVAVTAAIEEINQIENLDDGLKKSLTTQANFNAGRSLLSQFFSGNPSKTQMLEAMTLLEGGAYDSSVLSESQVNLVSGARSYAADSGKISEMRTTFGRQQQTVENRYVEAETRNEQARSLQRIKVGLGNGALKEDRVLLEQDLESRFASQLNGRTLASVWSDPGAMQDEGLAPIFQELSSSNIMPESLHNAFSSLARGSWQNLNPNVLLSHYSNFRDYQYSTTEMYNPMMDAMSDSERTILDFLADTIPVFGNQSPERLSEMFEMKRQYEEDESLQAKFKTFFGGQGPHDLVRGIEGMNDAPLNRVNGMAGAALSLFTSSRSTGLSASGIRDRLERQVDHSFPSGGGVVFGPGFSSRTAYPLSAAAPGNEDLFQEHLYNRIAASNPDLRINIGQGRAKITFRGLMPDIERAEDYIYLQVLDATSDGEVRYIVKQRQPAEAGGDKSIMNKIVGEDGRNILAPLIISNKDPQFLQMAYRRSSAERSDAINEATRRNQIYQEMRGTAERFTPGIVSPM